MQQAITYPRCDLTAYELIQKQFTKRSEREYLLNLNLRLLSRDELRLDAAQALKETRQSLLLRIVKLSKDSKEYKKAAANAATALVMAGFSFSNEDLSGVRIPYADLSGGVFERTHFQRANLKGVNFTNCYLNGADFTGAKVSGLRLGVILHNALHHEADPIKQIFFTSDNRFLISRGQSFVTSWNIAENFKVKEMAFQSAKFLLHLKDDFLLSCSEDGIFKAYSLPLFKPLEVAYTVGLSIVKDIHFSANNDFLILVRTPYSSEEDNFIEVLKLETDGIHTISLNRCNRVFFSEQIDKLYISSQSNLIALQIGSKLKLLTTPDLREINSLELKSKILDLCFSPTDNCLVMAKAGGIFLWHWDGDQEPQKLFSEDVRTISNLRIIPYGADLIFGYILNGNGYLWRSQWHSSPTLFLRDSRGVCICQTPLDNIGDSFLANTLLDVSKDATSLVIARGMRFTVMTLTSLLKNISPFRKDLTQGEFHSEKLLSVFDGQWRYFFETNNGRFIRSETKKENPIPKPQKFSVNVLKIAQRNYIEIQSNFSDLKPLRISVHGIEEGNDHVVLLDTALVYIDKNYIKLGSIQTNAHNIAYKELKKYQLEKIEGINKFLVSKCADFILFVNIACCVLINLKEHTLKKLEWGQDARKYEDWFEILDFESMDFDVSDNLCSLCYKAKMWGKTGTVFLWNLETSELIEEKEIPFLSFCVRFSPNGSLLACFGRNGVTMWSVKQKGFKLLWRMPSFLETNQTKLLERLEKPPTVTSKLSNDLISKFKFLSANDAWLVIDYRNLCLHSNYTIQTLMPRIDCQGKGYLQKYLGSMFHYIGLWGQAEEFLRNSRKNLRCGNYSPVDSHYINCLDFVGHKLYLKGNIQQAIQKYEEILTIPSPNRDHLRANMRIMLKNLYCIPSLGYKALDRLKEVARIAPSAKTFFALANYFYQQKNYNTAIICLHKANELKNREKKLNSNNTRALQSSENRDEVDAECPIDKLLLECQIAQGLERQVKGRKNTLLLLKSE